MASFQGTERKLARCQVNFSGRICKQTPPYSANILDGENILATASPPGTSVAPCQAQNGRLFFLTGTGGHSKRKQTGRRSEPKLAAAPLNGLLDKRRNLFPVPTGLNGMSKEERGKEGMYRSITSRQKDGNNEQNLIRRGAEEGIFIGGLTKNSGRVWTRMMKSLFLARGTPGMFLKGYPSRLKEECCLWHHIPGVKLRFSSASQGGRRRHGEGRGGGNCLGISSAAN